MDGTMTGGFVAPAPTGDGGRKEKAPAGNHPAVLVAVVDMGTQDVEYQGEKKTQHRVYWVWELVHEKVAGAKDENHVVAIDLTFSMHEKSTMRKWVQARAGVKLPDGQPYDVTKELGQPCLLNVVLNKNGYPKVDGVSALPKGMTCPAPQRKPFLWTLADYKRTGQIELPGWLPWLYGKPIRDYVAACQEIVGSGSTAAPNGSAHHEPAVPGHAVGGPPPRRKPAAPAGPRFFVAPNPEAEPLKETFTADEVVNRCSTGEWAIDVIEVCQDGTDAWVKPDAVGIKLPF
jgi:hypothetical protein